MKQLLEAKKAEILEAEKEKKVKRILSERAYEIVKKELKRYKFFTKAILSKLISFIFLTYFVAENLKLKTNF